MNQGPQANSTVSDIMAALRQALAAGEAWYPALLAAIGHWPVAEEEYGGRGYRYLIGGEAFDLLLLAERICRELADILPEDEVASLLLRGRPPQRWRRSEFKRLIGTTKYQQYLNYYYGIEVEEALFLAVQDEVRKERRSAGYRNEPDIASAVYRRIYGASQGMLLRRFQKEKGYPYHKSLELAELNEFTYWRFKYRLRQVEKARLASDTRKALDWLAAQGISRGLVSDEPPRTLSF